MSLYEYFSRSVLRTDGVTLVERRHVNPEGVAGSNPALVNLSLFIQHLSKKCTQSVSLVVYYMIFIEKSRIPLWCIPLLPFPRLYRIGRDPWLKGSVWFHDF